jgi:hypothetical protein
MGAQRKAREFTSGKAVRRSVPVWVGIAGPSGSGKTMSILRLLTGMVRVRGGKAGLIDTENNRGAHYADAFDYEHLPFSPPFGSLDYLDAVRYLIGKGCTAIGIDSMSHEHEGIGGVLEQHEAEIDRLITNSKAREKPSRNEMSLLAWNTPKMNRRHMIQSLLQLDVLLVYGFRAKEKLKIEGSKVEKLGWMPVAAEELVYEMTVQALLPPGSKGTPTWNPKGLGEKTTVKLPGQFEEQFRRARQFDEEMGAALATWGMGKAAPGLSDVAARGSTAERAAIIKDLGQLRATLTWDMEQALAWRKQVFGTGDVDALTAQQLTDARSLLDLKVSAGDEAYDAELANLIELGRLQVQP